MKRNSKAVSFDALVAAGVDPREASELSRIGLPVGELLCGHLLCEPQQSEELVLAYDCDVPLIVRNGQVWSVEDLICRFVNTGISAFAAVVDRYERYGHEVVRTSSHNQGRRIARRAAAEMKKLDPGAFTSDHAFWPLICDGMVNPI